ncbi:MAG: alpha-amylase [[Candidatus Thermochlorobacteriaceae] bacterium GBChlB]|nr:MAG: alpha-amylase [[Candidatus Thermochlorobacteriaceae] bacterium GBChlB]
MSLQQLLSALQSLPNIHETYHIPTLWHSDRVSVVAVNPREYYAQAIDRILAQPNSALPVVGNGEWSSSSVIYNLFVRTATAFDHNANGKLDLDTTSGFRETGTFLKSIALLPHIKRLGATVVHLLPITAIGSDGNKGTLGSPYAIKNPYKLDERLAEPALNLDAETEFKAFVEACHHLGLRVVVEFVFRTAAKDSDWVKEHPDWFYWIDERVQNRPQGATDEGRYGNPIFTDAELQQILAKVERGDFLDLPEPHAIYKSMYVSPPHTVEYHDGRYIGLTNDQRVCRIPGAFADWPPQDTQPPWNDVTYLKLYTHPHYNYIAYNTVRMYEANLAKPEYINQPLWEKIIGIIPYYQDAFDIDGVMIDMGHSLPADLKKSIIQTARRKNPDFAFWDENFNASRKSREQGYNAVIGSMPFVAHELKDLKKFIRDLLGSIAISSFATAESHNTPRAAARFGGGAAGKNFSKFFIALASVLPAIPFLHNGVELCEWYPINTGLGFSPDDLKFFPSEQLPLFSARAFNWTGDNGVEPITAYISKVMSVRAKYLDVIANYHHGSTTLLSDEQTNLIILTRQSGSTQLLFVGNANPIASESVKIPLSVSAESLLELYSEQRFAVESQTLRLTLAPGESALFDIS